MRILRFPSAPDEQEGILLFARFVVETDAGFFCQQLDGTDGWPGQRGGIDCFGRSDFDQLVCL